MYKRAYPMISAKEGKTTRYCGAENVYFDERIRLSLAQNTEIIESKIYYEICEETYCSWS